MSTAIIPEIPTGTIKVEIAWNYPTSSTYTDITSDVRMEQGLSWSLGRADESSRANPAELKLTLTNTASKYSQAGASANYPNVLKKNRPIRVTINPADGGGDRVAFHGYSTGLTPGWDSLTGKIPVARLSASGTLRRIKQGEQVIASPMYRWMLKNASDLMLYVPCEVGKYATSMPEAGPTANSSPMTWTGTADLASCDDFIGSLPLPRMSNAQYWDATYAQTLIADKSQSFRALVSFPEASSAPPDNTILFRTALTGGDIWTFYIRYRTGGFLQVDASAATTLGTTTGLFSVDGQAGLLSLEMYQSGGSVFYGLNWLQEGATTYSSLPGSPSVVATLGQMYGIEVNYAKVDTDVGFGHLSLWKVRSASDPVTDFYQALNGYPGELIPETTGRIQRICDENGITLTFYDTAETDFGPTDYAGPMEIATVSSIIEDCEEAERGFLWDGLALGLSYTTRRKMEAATTALTINAATGQLGPGFEPVDDDQGIRNQWTVNRKDGAEFTITQATGNLGSDNIGLYNDSKTVNVFTDYGARNLADWLVYQGTVEGYRYPTVDVNLRATPWLAGSVLNLYPGARIDITNPATALDSFPGETISLIVEGIEHQLSATEWTVKFNCSRYGAWAVGTLASDTGDTDDHVLRIQPNYDLRVAGTAAANATTLLIQPSLGSEPVTIVADDFPAVLLVDGVEVRATACAFVSGATWSLTVDPLPKAMAFTDTVYFKTNVLGL
jgi:hypothetical protein